MKITKMPFKERWRDRFPDAEEFKGREGGSSIPADS